MASTVTVLTGYEYPDKPEMAVHWDAVARRGGTLVFLMTTRQLKNNMDKLIAAGIDPAELRKRNAKLVADEPRLVVPRVHHDLTTTRILAMEYMPGERLETLADAEVPQPTRDAIGTLLIQTDDLTAGESGLVRVAVQAAYDGEPVLVLDPPELNFGFVSYVAGSGAESRTESVRTKVQSRT